MAVSSTSGVNFSSSFVQTDEEGTSQHIATMTLAVATENDPQASDDGLALEVAADAIAVGEDTVAMASIAGMASDTDAATELHSTVELAAYGEASGDELAYAATSGYASMLGEADRSFSLSYTTTAIAQGEEGMAASATTLTEFYALDLHEPELAVAVEAEQFTLTDEPGEAELAPLGMDIEDWPDHGFLWSPEVDGNSAFWEISALAIGDDSLAQVNLSALTVEDELSSILAFLQVAVA